MTSLTIAVMGYSCPECAKRGQDVRELVRMMPRSAILFDQIVGDEWWSCPVCFTPQFPVNKRKQKGYANARLTGQEPPKLPRKRSAKRPAGSGAAQDK